MIVPATSRAGRLAVAAAAALLAAGCSAGGPGGGQPASPAQGASGPAPALTAPGAVPTTIAGYYAQRLRWRPCHQRFECASLLVPFDFRRPAWRRFSLPVIRLAASGPGRRIGSLVLNPGGPGASGVQFALEANTVVSAAVRARFDVVGFDPRGVAGSVPAISCLTGPQLDSYLATETPVTASQVAAVAAISRQFAQRCERRSGALLRYVGTANAARDMDVLRAALGDTKLTYLGKSYGTFLGTWYAQLFPTHVRALVLDGAVNPSESALAMNAVQAGGFEVALRSFTASCVRLAGCPLGNGSVGAAIDRLQGLLNRTAVKPLSSQVPGQPANAAMVLGGVATALYSKAYWRYLREGLTGAFAGNGTVLVELADVLAGRSPNGSYTNLVVASTAISCVDRPWPRRLATWQAAAAAAARSAPQFGAAVIWGGLACAYWPVQAAAPVRLGAAGTPPVLVVGTTRDPATPFQGARALSRDLRSGVLLGWDGDGHTAYREGSSCVDAAVDRYLIDLVPPPAGTICS